MSKAKKEATAPETRQPSMMAQKLLSKIQEEASKEINEVLQMDFEAQSLPKGTKFDQQEGVWVLPTEE